jgi:tRNA dimethylallyltransferase
MQLITILGQTCSGKTQMSINLFRHFQSLHKSCWVVNCDSRQIYQKLNYGTAKVEGEWKDGVYWVEGDVPHLLIDYVNPTVQYNLGDYLKDFCDLFSTTELPDYVILVGGTGLYAKAINEEMDLGFVKKEYEKEYSGRKKELNSLSLTELQGLLFEQNLELNQSDFHNKIRLVSNLLRLESLQKHWLEEIYYPKFEKKIYCAIDILDQQDLQIKIKNRIKLRINQGLLEETKSLTSVLGSVRVDELGLEYRLTRKFLTGEITESEWIEQLGNENWQYAKRQMTWLKREGNIIWIDYLERILEMTL